MYSPRKLLLGAGLLLFFAAVLRLVVFFAMAAL
jgi:hypothetical protein